MKHFSMYKFHTNRLYSFVFLLKIHASNALTKKTLLSMGVVRTCEISANTYTVNTRAIL